MDGTQMHRRKLLFSFARWRDDGRVHHFLPFKKKIELLLRVVVVCALLTFNGAGRISQRK